MSLLPKNLNQPNPEEDYLKQDLARAGLSENLYSASPLTDRQNRLLGVSLYRHIPGGTKVNLGMVKARAVQEDGAVVIRWLAEESFDVLGGTEFMNPDRVVPQFAERHEAFAKLAEFDS